MEKNSWRQGHWVIFVLLCALGALHVFYYFPHMTDDAYISLRYAERFMEGKGLTWNDGEYVEGYSNLLWVLLIAGLGKIGFDLEFAPVALGLASIVLTVPAFLWYGARAHIKPEAVLIGLLVFFASPPVAIWVTGGLETPMVLLLYTWALLLYYRLFQDGDIKTAAVIGGCLAATCWLRPEAPIYVALPAFAYLALSSLPLKTRIKALCLTCGIPLLAFLAQLAFRLYYYDEWVANTVLAKVAFTPVRFTIGFIYICKAYALLLPLILYVFLNFYYGKIRFLQSPGTRFITFLLCIFTGVTTAIAAGGGDTFLAFRAFVPVWTIPVILTAHAFQFGLEKTYSRKEYIFFGYIFLCFAWLQFFAQDNNDTRLESHWINGAKAMGLYLKDHYTDEQPLVAVHGAGAIPFFSQLPSLDIYGLNDAALTKNRNHNPYFGRRIMGHELFDAEYVLSRKADILAFEIPGNLFCIEDEHKRYMFDEECRKIFPYYRRKIITLPGNRKALLWIRKDSDKVK